MAPLCIHCHKEHVFYDRQWKILSEAATQRCSQEKVFWKYAANLLENTHAEVRFHFIEISLRHGCSPVNLLHIFRTTFTKNTSWWLLLNIWTTMILKRFENQKNSQKIIHFIMIRNFLYILVKVTSPPTEVFWSF